MIVGFDLDGVLLDSESDRGWLDRALDRALEEAGLAVTAANRRTLYPHSVHDFEACAEELGFDPEELWSIRTRHYTREKVRAVESGEIDPFPDLDELERVADRPLFLVSNSPQEVVDAFLETTGRGDLFAVAVGRGQALSDLDDLKPATTFYERVADELGDGEYVYVGNAGTDREFAARAGMGYVHLDRAERDLAAAVDDVLSREWERP